MTTKEKIYNEMKIMIIEDEDYKYNTVIEVLNKLIDKPIIIIAKSRNSGLRMIKEYYQNNNYFNLIICDNYMPLFDNDNRIIPCASDIINYIKRFISKEISICVFSSEEIDLCNYDYYIKYDRSISQDIFEEELKQIFNIINNNKKVLSKKNSYLSEI